LAPRLKQYLAAGGIASLSGKVQRGPVVAVLKKGKKRKKKGYLEKERKDRVESSGEQRLIRARMIKRGGSRVVMYATRWISLMLYNRR
jgi:hypothetical protein